jgi:hypothetical protein
MAKPNKLKRVLIYFAFFLSLIPIEIFAYKHPAYNWDMLGYMALIVKMSGSENIDEIHSITYNTAKQEIPARDYDNLTGSVPIRRTRFQNSSEFNAVLPLYAVKPLYIWLSFAFYKAGFSLPISTVLPSMLGYLLIGLLVFHWISKQHKQVLSFLSALLIMSFPFMIEAARLSTPDSISAFLLLSAFYFVLEKASVSGMFFFLALSVLARIDNVVICFALISFLFFREKHSSRISLAQYLTMISVLIGVYFLVSSMSGGRNWNIGYYPTFIKHYSTDHQLQPSFSITKYFSLLYERGIMAVLYTHFSLFSLLSIAMIGTQPSTSLRTMSIDTAFCFLLIIVILIRFFLFPDLEDRFYIAYYLVILIVLMRQFKIWLIQN